MIFKSPPKTFSNVLSIFSSVLLGLGLIVFGGAFIWKFSWVGILGSPFVFLGAMALKASWDASLYLEVELSKSPREIRCWRKNVFTGLRSFRRYAIPDNAKIVVDVSQVEDNKWPVVIAGLPSYLDFSAFKGAKRWQDAWAVAYEIAELLDIPVPLKDSAGGMDPKHEADLLR
jgi:hypothetical protein